LTSLFFAVGAALMAAQTPAPITQGPLTVEEAIAIAERNAFAVRLQQSNIERNRQRVAEARAGLGPTVGAGVNYTRFPEAITANIGGPGTPPVVVQPIDNTTGTVTLNLPIDIAGNRGRLVRANRASLRASQTTLEATRNDTRLNVRQAYFNVLRSQAAVGVAEQAVRDAEERLAQARLLLQGEQIARIEVTRLEAQVTQANTDLIAARNTAQLQRNAFNLTLARPIETPVELVDVAELPPLQPEIDTIVRTAQTRRPEIRAFSDTLEALANIRRAQESSLNPSLNFSLSYQRNLNPGALGGQKEQTTGLLALNIPIFDSGATRARVRQARQDEEQARINLEQVTLGVSQEVRNAITNLTNAQSRLTNAQSQVRLAEEVYRIARVRQQAGEGTYVEVVDALTQLAQARNQVVAARYDYLTAFAQLQRAVGVDDVNAVAPTTAPTGNPTNGGNR